MRTTAASRRPSKRGFPALRNLYESTILGRPVATLVVVTAITLSLGWFAPDLSLDASADSLILDRDDDLRYYSSIRTRSGSDDFLIVTYPPSILMTFRQASRYLEDADTDRELARQELINSPLFQDLIINTDATSTINSQHLFTQRWTGIAIFT